MAKRVYDDEFKVSAVALAEQFGTRKAADELGIPSSTLNSWIRSHDYDNAPEEETTAEIETEADPIEEAAESEEPDYNDDHYDDDLFDEELYDDDDYYEDDDLFGDELLPHIPEEEPSLYADDPFGEEAYDGSFPYGGFDINSCMLPDSSCDDLYDEMCLNGSIKNYFFIDYENVNHSGLVGLEKLSAGDCIRIYYGRVAQTIPFPYMRKLNRLRARVEYTKVLLPIENGADCQILFEVLQAFRSSPLTNFYIISKDTDFDVPIEEFKKIFGLNITKIRKIEDAFPQITQPMPVPQTVAVTQSNIPIDFAKNLSRNDEIEYIFDTQLDMPPYIDHRSDILRLLKTSPDKLTLNSGLAKLIPGTCVSTIFKTFKDILQNLPQQAPKNSSAKKADKTRAKWISEVESTYDANFNSGIYVEKRALILNTITASTSKVQLNSNLCKLIPGANVSEIFKALKELLNDIPKA